MLAFLNREGHPGRSVWVEHRPHSRTSESYVTKACPFDLRGGLGGKGLGGTHDTQQDSVDP